LILKQNFEKRLAGLAGNKFLAKKCFNTFEINYLLQNATQAAAFSHLGFLL